MSEWQPIETYPGPKTHALLWAFDEEEFDEAEADEREPRRQVIAGYESGMQPGVWWYSGIMRGLSKPTHWMPLPPPPQGSQQG